MVNTERRCAMKCYSSVELVLETMLKLQKTVYQSFPISMTVEQCLTVCHHEPECISIYYQTESKNCTLYRNTIYEYQKKGKHVICQTIDTLTEDTESDEGGRC